MKYCNHCRRITAGQPLFCMFCGRTFDVRLCPRLHVSPRHAEVCAQCGSRDLTQPHPRTTWTMRLLQVTLRRLPTLLLVVIGIVVALGMVQAVLTDQQLQGQLVVLLLIVAAGWIAWSKLPGPVRTGVRRVVTKMTKSNRGERH